MIQELKAGQVSLFYADGFLRKLNISGTEILRMIYFAVRDADWGTWEPVFLEENITAGEDYFSISYRAQYLNNDGPFFEWLVRIAGAKDNTITFEINGKAHQAFETNRAGFCILHPIAGVAGEPVRITHASGAPTTYRFPETIAPDQPFVDISAMEWKTAGCQLSLQFNGDIFETEDQRNWGDASYKTYCTPLYLPLPKKLQPGDTVRQQVRFTAKQGATESKPATDTPPKANFTFATGICAEPENRLLPDVCVTKLRQLPLVHYRVEVMPSQPSWKKAFAIQCENARNLGLPLELVAVLSDDYTLEMAALLQQTAAQKIAVKYLLLLSRDAMVTQAEVADRILIWKNKWPETAFGIGTNYNFTEFNRNHLATEQADFVSFSFHPQVHASDDWTIMENAETLLYQVRSAWKMYGKPVHISPVLLKARFNPYAADPGKIAIPAESQIDSRLHTDFMKKWTEAVRQALSQSGVAAVSFLHTSGPLGIVDWNGASYPVFEEIKKPVVSSQ